jgi:hypothetical protein
MNLNPVGWASAALRLLARLDSDGVNSITPVTEINGGAISATNADIALVAKGTGATLAQVPDGTIAGGNKRGTGATDWQKVRSFQTHIASGNYATISGGERNTASDVYCTVGGGFANNASNIRATVSGGYINTASGNSATVAGGNQNQASSDYSFVGSGQSNLAQTGTHATVCGGNGNTASNGSSFVGGGQNNLASNTFATVAGGFSNTASFTGSTVGGGSDNLANGIYSVIPGGRYGLSRQITGYHVFAACNAPIASFYGVTQSALLLLARQTTDATATVLTSNTIAASTTNQVILPNNSAYYFRGSVIAGVTGAGDSKSWTFEGAIKRGANAGTTAIVGTVILNTIAQNAGASAWGIAITADTTNGGIAVTVTGALATTIRWVAKIETTEMTY